MAKTTRFRQKIRAIVVESSHTTPKDAEKFLERVKAEEANVVVLPTEFNVAAFNKMKRGGKVDFGTRYADHDKLLVEGLAEIFRKRRGKFAVVRLKETDDAATQFQASEAKLAREWRKRGWEQPGSLPEDHKRAARRRQEKLHAEASDLGNLLENDLKNAGKNEGLAAAIQGRHNYFGKAAGRKHCELRAASLAGFWKTAFS